MKGGQVAPETDAVEVMEKALDAMNESESAVSIPSRKRCQ